MHSGLHRKNSSSITAIERDQVDVDSLLNYLDLPDTKKWAFNPKTMGIYAISGGRSLRSNSNQQALQRMLHLTTNVSKADTEVKVFNDIVM